VHLEGEAPQGVLAFLSAVSALRSAVGTRMA